MVEARAAIGKHPRETRGISRARSEVDRYPAPAAPHGRRQDPLNVNGIGAAFEAVQDEQPRTRGGPSDVVQDEIVAVGRLQDLADEDYLASGPGELPPGRLEMRTWKPPGRAKGRLHAGDSTRLSAAALT